tara:strand:+ start:2980 stop:4086 length:1107 start_codon:yes stop_codon:yes gene_type:complete
MPINAKPEYFQAEKKYHLAETIPEKLAALEEMLKTSPSHKGGENLRAQIKQRIAKLRAQLDKNRQTSKGKGKSFAVKQEGAAQVVLVSVTNAGKSSLLKALTNAKPEVADYAYTTTKTEVGIMDVDGIQIQLIEIPAIFKDFAYKGDGPSYFGVIRNADLIVHILDNTQDINEQRDIFLGELDKAQIRLDSKKPLITIKKQGTGGIEYMGKRYFEFTVTEANKVLQSHGYHNAMVTAHAPVTIEDLSDMLNESIIYKRILIVRNKADLKGEGFSAKTGKGLKNLKLQIQHAIGLIKVYTKTPGKEKEFPPVALHTGDTIKSLASEIHKDFLRRFRFARIWGESTKHQGQKVGLDHRLKDNDIVEFHLK